MEAGNCKRQNSTLQIYCSCNFQTAIKSIKTEKRLFRTASFHPKTYFKLFLHFHNVRRRLLRITLLSLLHNIFSQLYECTSGNAVLIQSSGSTLITILTNTLYNRDLSQQRHIHFFRQLLGSFFSKDKIFIFRKFGRSKP